MAAQPSDQAPPPGQPRPSSVADASNNSVLDRLGELDRAVSLAAYRSVGCKLPRPLLMLYEHAGNGLFWLPGMLGKTLLMCPADGKLCYPFPACDFIIPCNLTREEQQERDRVKSLLYA